MMKIAVKNSEKRGKSGSKIMMEFWKIDKNSIKIYQKLTKNTKQLIKNVKKILKVG